MGGWRQKAGAGHRGRRYGLAAWLVHCERIFTAGASLTLAPGNEEDPLCMAPWKGRSYCQGWTLGGGAGKPSPSPNAVNPALELLIA